MGIGTRGNCNSCSGDGWVDNTSGATSDCKACDGTGWTTDTRIAAALEKLQDAYDEVLLTNYAGGQIGVECWQSGHKATVHFAATLVEALELAALVNAEEK